MGKGDIKVAIEGLVREEAYLRDMGVAQASLASAIVGLPAQIQNWGPWEVFKSHIEESFRLYDETVSTAKEGLDGCAELMRGTREAYVKTEEALTLGRK